MELKRGSFENKFLNFQLSLLAALKLFFKTGQELLKSSYLSLGSHDEALVVYCVLAKPGPELVDLVFQAGLELLD